MMEEFPPGTITEIELHDFMTYEHVIQKPGPNINFILGRNGSGKSSIVCAIALGCGSSPSFIGRGNVLADFIKHGKPKASIQLTLSNPEGEPVVIRRILHRGSRGNECFFNRTPVTMELYMEKIKTLNIMTDNLVQFLPQERVIDFSLMTPIQLLENTEKTIGEECSKIHQELIAKGNAWEDGGAEIARLRKALDESKDKEAQMKHDVEALDAREDIVVAMRITAVKKDRLEIVAQGDSLVESKTALEKMNDMIEKMASIVVPSKTKMISGKTLSIKSTKALMDAKKEVDIHKTLFDSTFFAAEPDALQKENAADLGALRGAKTRDEERLVKIKKAQTAQHNLETQRTDVDIPSMKLNVVALQQEQMKIKGQIDATSKKKIKVNADNRSVEDQMSHLISEINRLENSEDGLTQYLRANDATSFRAREWIKTNAARLRGKVFGPIYAEIKIKSGDKHHADILGAVIPWDVKNMFVCEEDADVDLLLEEMVKGQNIKVPIKCMSRTSRPSIVIDPGVFRKRIGCQALVSELFDAPESVHRFLLNRFRLANTPVFDTLLDNANFDRIKSAILQNGKVIASLMFIAGSTFRFRTTRFSSTLASNSQPTPEERRMRELMSISREKPDLTNQMNQLDSLKEKLEEIKNVEQEILQVVTAEQSKFAAISLEIQKKRTAITDAEKITSRIRIFVEELQRLEAQRFNYDEEKVKTATKIRERNMKSWTKMLSKEVSSTRVLEKTIHVTLEYVNARTDVRNDSQEVKKNLRKMITLWMQYRELATSHERDLNKLKENLTNHLKLLRDVPGSSDNKLSAEALKQYRELPADILQLDALYKSKRQQLNAAGDINEHARRDLDRQIAATEKLQHSIATRNDDIAKEKERAARMRKKWMDTIQKLVTQIGTSFSSFYRSMNLAGDVVLQCPDNPDNYEKYGFAIKVSYRQGRQMETLSGQIHSGGEKSVATALYMLAIQELTKCPFRVVDEINQGMDAENERRVFKMIVETAARCGGQYFILSPKLLPDLHLSENVTVTVILTGNAMHSGGDLDMWNITNMIRRFNLRKNLLSSGRTNSLEKSSSRKRPRETDDDDSQPEMDESSIAKHRRPPIKKLTTINRAEKFK